MEIQHKHILEKDEKLETESPGQSSYQVIISGENWTNQPFQKHSTLLVHSELTL